MNLALAVSESLAEQPGYIMPCPMCSFLDVLDTPDFIRSPTVLRSRLTTKLHFLPVSGSCAVCGKFKRTGDSETEIASAWLLYVAEVAREHRAELVRSKVVRTLGRLHRRGRVPAAFPMPA